MVKEYVFEILTRRYVRVAATNREDAYERAEEDGELGLNADDSIVSIDLVDIVEEDVDSIYDEYRGNEYDEF